MFNAGLFCPFQSAFLETSLIQSLISYTMTFFADMLPRRIPLPFSNLQTHFRLRLPKQLAHNV